MTRYAAFLRAVNVGGTGKMPMADLRSLCEAAGFADVQTYIASGNVALSHNEDAGAVKARLEAAIATYAGKSVPVMVRDGAALAQILADNPYAEHAGNRVIAMLLERAPNAAMLDDPIGLKDEELALGAREIYVHFPSGMGQSRLKVPGADIGTARNINTLVRMAEMVGVADT